MAFEILNEAASVVYVLAGVNRYPQAEPDKVDFDIIAQGIDGEGVVSGCLVTPQGIPDTTVAVAAGTIVIGSAHIAYAGGNVNCGAAHAAFPRFDLIAINNAGVASAVNGVAAEPPVFPAVPANSVIIAAVWRAANDNTITAADIVDKRANVDIVGPAGATDEAFPRFDAATGKLLQDSLVLCDNAGNITGVLTLDVDDYVRVNGISESFTWAAVPLTARISALTTALLQGAFRGHNQQQANVLAQQIYLTRARDAAGAPSIVQDGDHLGDIDFSGYDGVDYHQGAAIRVVVDGVPAADFMPAKMEFYIREAGGPVLWLTPNEVANCFNFRVLEMFQIVDALTPAQITADQNDYSPPNLLNHIPLRLSSDATRNITGLNAGGVAYREGRVRVIVNIGNFDIVLNHESGLSAAANRFALDGTDLRLEPGNGIVLWYDEDDLRWRCAGQYGGGGGNTLDEAYDQDGAGAGRTIAADSGRFKVTDDGIETTNLVVNKSTELIDANDEIGPLTTAWVYLNAGGAADNLLGIIGGTEGQIVILTPTAGKNITLIHNSGAVVAGDPLMINGEADVLLDEDHDLAIAIHDVVAAVWNVLVPGAGGGAAAETTFLIPASAFSPVLTTGATAPLQFEGAANAINHWGLQFSAGDMAIAQAIVPANHTGDIKARFIWRNQGINSIATWAAAAIAIGDNEDPDGNPVPAYVAAAADTGATVGFFYKTAQTAALNVNGVGGDAAAGELLILYVKLNSVTVASTAILVGVELEYDV